MTDILLGIVVPGAVFLFSFGMTWLLYRHFSQPGDKTPDSKE